MGQFEITILLVAAAPVFGGFIRVVTERLPQGDSLVFGRSRCSSCHQIVGTADLMPFVTWIRLRGRCRNCGSPTRPTLEILALAVALWAIATAESAWPSALLGWTLLALAIIDWRHMLLPDVLTLPLLVGGLLTAATAGIPSDHLVGAVAAALTLLIVGSVFRIVSGKDGLGLGDVKLFAAGGAWIGWQGLPGALLVAALTALLYAILAGRWHDRENRLVPFGPFLAAGIWLSWLYGPIRF